MIATLPDAAAAERARAEVRDAYEAKGGGAGMAAFIAMTSWRASSPTPTSPSPRPIRRCSGCRPRTTAPATTRCCPTFVGGHRLPARRRRAGRGADPDRDRRRRGVRGHVDRAYGGGDRGAARPAGDGVPEPPRRLPRRRVRLRGAARGLRAQAAGGTRLGSPTQPPRSWLAVRAPRVCSQVTSSALPLVAAVSSGVSGSHGGIQSSSAPRASRYRARRFGRRGRPPRTPCSRPPPTADRRVGLEPVHQPERRLAEQRGRRPRVRPAGAPPSSTGTRSRRPAACRRRSPPRARRCPRRRPAARRAPRRRRCWPPSAAASRRADR